MLVCIYRTLTTFLESDMFVNNINIMVTYSISRDLYLSGDARQMVLDILVWVKSNLDRTLSFRSSCCEGVCGSCAMLINNSNTLACIQPIWLINSYITIYPLPHFNVVRDLVVDLKHFYEQYAYINPFYDLYDASGFSDSTFSSYTLSYLYMYSSLVSYKYLSNKISITLFCINSYMYLLIYYTIYISFIFSCCDKSMGYYFFLKLGLLYLIF